MTHVDVAESTRLQQITIAAIGRAAGRGLFTVTEAGVMIDRMRAKATTPSSSIQDSSPIGGAGAHPRAHSPVDPDRTVR